MNRSPVTYHIREANEEDFAGIVALLHQFALFQKTPERMKMTLGQLQQDKGKFHFLLAVTHDDVIAGYVCFFQAYYSWSGKAFYIDDLYVREEYRGCGIGRDLLKTVVEKARTENCMKVRWQVSRWNETAIQFYKSLGAVTDDTELNCDLML